MNKNVFLIAMIFVSVFFLTGCQQEENTILSEQKTKQVIDFAPKMAQSDIDRILSRPVKVKDQSILEELQFMRDQNMISPQFYEVLIRMDMPQKVGDYEAYPGCYESFCDMTHSREGIRNMMKEHYNDTGNVFGRHRRHTNMYSSTGGTITLRVKTSTSSGVPTDNQVPSVWVSAINSAVTDWNNLGYKVKFKVITAADNTNPSGYVNISRGPIYGNLLELARAELPQSSNTFGSYMIINSHYVGDTPTTSARRFTINHELGHIIGLRHTDDSSDPYGSWVHSSISCGGTTNYTDPSSVFRATVNPSLSSWPGFTSCDKTVIDYYWGKTA